MAFGCITTRQKMEFQTKRLARRCLASRAMVNELEPRAMLTATWLSAVGDGHWNSTNNWQGGHIPTTGENVVFAAPGNSNFEHITLATPVVVGSMTFEGAYAFDGASIQPQGTISTTQYTRFSNALVLDRNTVVDVAGGVRLDILGGLTGSAFDLNKTGAGRLFVGSTVANHAIHVNGGVLEQDNATDNAVTAATGTTVRGSATMASLVTTGATLSFDDGDGGTTDMTVHGAVAFDAATTFSTPVGDDGSSGLRAGHLTVTGSTAVHLSSATLDLVDDGSSPTIGGTVTLIANQTGLPVVGTFVGLPEGTTVTVGGFHLAITYRGGSSGHDVVLSTVDTPPTIASGATTQASTSRRPTVHVLGSASSGPESALTYQWSVTDAPDGAGSVRFNRNNSNAAKLVTPRFHAAGTYQLQCRVSDTSGASTFHTLTIKVKQKATGIRVRPHEASITNGTTLQYSAYVYDQFGSRMHWHQDTSYAIDEGSATIDAAGLLSATGSGHLIVRVTINDITGVAGATIF